MSIYHIQTESIFSDGKYNAAGKPVMDVISILNGSGIIDLSNVRQVATLFGGKLATAKSLKNFFDVVNSHDTVVVQYPLYMSYIAVIQLIKLLRKRNVNLIFLVHDINSLRISGSSEMRGIGHTRDPQKSLKNELRILKQATGIIAPTNSMKLFLESHGLSCNFSVLGLYDYLDSPNSLDDESSSELQVPQNIIFAGNLTKAEFLSKIRSPKDFQYQVFGIKPNNYTLSKDVSYEGAFPSDELVTHFKPGFGLVWDGDSCETVTGVSGEYLRYNSPFKASMYLESGFPVIIWENSAIAQLILQKNIGMAVSSLSDAEERIRNLSIDEYRLMKDNVRRLSMELSSGNMTRKALEKLI
ncbi:beta-1,6-galactofuranosyltransferase [Lacticaseibacillus paracasei subsp. tolerans]|nr:hypothetical protein [Lacticaseibacillus paracasei]GEL38635.1 beta-1,6-galactofuranosyltransferase [Lacticaseibacillus paracasei subsp. tolerans]